MIELRARLLSENSRTDEIESERKLTSKTHLSLQIQRMKNCCAVFGFGFILLQVCTIAYSNVEKFKTKNVK